MIYCTLLMTCDDMYNWSLPRVVKLAPVLSSHPHIKILLLLNDLYAAQKKYFLQNCVGFFAYQFICIKNQTNRDNVGEIKEVVGQYNYFEANMLFNTSEKE